MGFKPNDTNVFFTSASGKNFVIFRDGENFAISNGKNFSSGRKNLFNFGSGSFNSVPNMDDKW